MHTESFQFHGIQGCKGSEVPFQDLVGALHNAGVNLLDFRRSDSEILISALAKIPETKIINICYSAIREISAKLGSTYRYKRSVEVAPFCL